jgi:hypothetical protein
VIAPFHLDEMEIVWRGTDGTQREQRLRLRVLRKIELELMGFKLLTNRIQSLAVGEGIPRAIEVQEKGSAKGLSGKNARRLQLPLAIAGQLKGNDLSFDLCENVIHIPFLVSVQDRHTSTLQDFLIYKSMGY